MGNFDFTVYSCFKLEKQAIGKIHKNSTNACQNSKLQAKKCVNLKFNRGEPTRQVEKNRKVHVSSCIFAAANKSTFCVDAFQVWGSLGNREVSLLNGELKQLNLK